MKVKLRPGKYASGNLVTEIWVTFRSSSLGKQIEYHMIRRAHTDFLAEVDEWLEALNERLGDRLFTPKVSSPPILEAVGGRLVFEERIEIKLRPTDAEELLDAAASLGATPGY